MSRLPSQNTDRKPPIVIIGGGGHALVVAEAATLAGMQVVGLLDDDPDAPLCRPPQPVMRIGALQDFATLGDRPWILGVGNLGFREQLLHRLDQLELSRTARSVVHPTAHISPTARIGVGVYVGPNAVVHARATLLDHAIVNSGAIVEHECWVGVNAHLAPGSVMAGGSRLGNNSLIGVGARLLPLLSVGDGCTVGAGAVVLRSVLDGQTVVGVPAKPQPERTARGQ